MGVIYVNMAFYSFVAAREITSTRKHWETLGCELETYHERVLLDEGNPIKKSDIIFFGSEMMKTEWTS